MGAISDLYCGRISAPEEVTVNAAEYSKLNGRAEELYQSLKKQLSEDGVKTLDELVDIQQQIDGLSAEDSYTKGFRNGAAIMLDVLNK